MLQSSNNGKTNSESIQQSEVKVVVGISAFNSEQVLEKMVAPLRAVVDGIIICDNGSSDSTLKIAKELDLKTVSLVRHVDDSSAILSLFQTASEMNADVLITLAPGVVVQRADIESLAVKIVMDHSDIAVGTNSVIGKMGMDNSPVKAYSRNALAKISSPEYLNLEAARKLKLEISNCPVSWIPKDSGLTNKGSSIADSQNRQEKAISKGKGGLDRVFYLKSQPLSLRFLFTNIWSLRSMIIASGAIVSVLLLAYSLLFIYTFNVVGSTTSYFPWAWDVLLSNSGTVTDYFGVGLVVSLDLLVVFAIIFFKWISPELRISLEAFKKRLQLNSSTF